MRSRLSISTLAALALLVVPVSAQTTGSFLRGQVNAADTLLPLAGIDLDVIGADGNLVPGIDGVTDADGQFVLGPVPPGDYTLRVDPTLAQGFVRQYLGLVPGFQDATLLTVDGVNDIVGLRFAPSPGGGLTGRVRELGTGSPVAGLDLDLFTGLAELVGYDAGTDTTGFYDFGIVPVGTYAVRVDPTGDQPWADRYYDDSADLAGATYVTVTQSQVTSGIDFVLERLLFISGSVTDAATGADLALVDLDVLSPDGVTLNGYDGRTDESGAYVIGPIEPGSYLLRVDAGADDPWVDQYHPGVLRLSQATPITLTTSDADGIDFALPRGGWIRGTIARSVDGTPLAGIDLDVFFPDGEPIPSVDADTDSLGRYRIGPLPTGQFVLRADPDPILALETLYWPTAVTVNSASAVQVLVGLDTSAIDFSLGALVATSIPDAAGEDSLLVLAPPSPNPFGPATVVQLRQGLEPITTAQIFDARGRLVRRLQVDAAHPGAEVVLRWDGRDDTGREAASGTYFLRFGSADAPALKLMRIR